MSSYSSLLTYLLVVVCFFFATIFQGLHGQEDNLESPSENSSLSVPEGSDSYQTQKENLLNYSKYRWKALNYASIFQNEDTLRLVVEPNKDLETFSRAYLRTQLNSSDYSDLSSNLSLSLRYSLKSFAGDADMAVEVRDNTDDRVLLSHELTKNSTSAIFPLSLGALDKPVEFRLYVITRQPGLHVLMVEEFNILITNQTQTQLQPSSAATNDSSGWNSYLESVVFDPEAIPFYDYGYVDGVYIGLQRYPITIEHEALRFYDTYLRSGRTNETSKQYFLNNADWLVNNSKLVNHSGSMPYGIYQHTFPWPHYKLEAPWQSGMAQGRALIVMVRAHELTGDQKYLNSAKLILNSFMIDVKDGGVTNKSDDSGWWYEEYASSGKNSVKDSRVLNGMIFAVLGIHEYYTYTHDPQAKFLFDQGILALKNDLPLYENKNGGSFYDALGTVANSEYHKLHISQLKQLYDVTNDTIFKQFQYKWENSQ